MKFRKVLLGDISKFNQDNYKKNLNWDFVNYLDTGNLTENKIDEIQYISLKDEKLPSRAKRLVSENSILFSTVRPNQNHYGFAKNINIENLLVSTGFAVIDVYEKTANPKYIYYQLIQPKNINRLQSIGETATSAYPSVTMDDLKEIEISLPSLYEQNVITSLLSSFDDKIENNNAIIANLEAQAQAIFKSWFVDFEPFQDGEFVESELGPIPKGWEVKYLSQIFNICYGKNLAIKKLLQVGYPVYGGNGVIGFYNEYLYESPKLIVSCRGAASGKVGLSRSYSFITNNSLIFDEKNKDSFYYYKYLFNNIKFTNYVTGSAQPQLTISNVKAIKIPMPDSTSITYFTTFVKPLLKNQFKLEKSNEILAELRDTLLPKLMSGEIRVGESVDEPQET